MSPVLFPIRFQRGPVSFETRQKKPGKENRGPQAPGGSLGSLPSAAMPLRKHSGHALQDRAAFLPRRPPGGHTEIRSAYGCQWQGLHYGACATRGRVFSFGSGYLPRIPDVLRDGAPAKDRMVGPLRSSARRVPVPVTNDVAYARRGSCPAQALASTVRETDERRQLSNTLLPFRSPVFGPRSLFARERRPPRCYRPTSCSTDTPAVPWP